MNHITAAARSLCGSPPGLAASWPPGHLAVPVSLAPADADCPECLRMHAEANSASSRYILTMHVVTKNPSDYPGKRVVRKHEVWTNRVVAHAEPEMVLPMDGDSLLQIAIRMDDLGLTRFPPSVDDDPVIEMVWL